MFKVLFKYVTACSLLALVSCGNAGDEPYRVPDNAQKLLTADSLKTWKIAKRINNGYRMNMGDCFLDYRLSFFASMLVKDNNGESNDCGDSLEAAWSFFSNDNGDYIKFKSESLKELMHIENDYKFFKIQHISSDSLVLSYKHKQYSNNSLKIVDYYVPQDVQVKDRAFHH